MKCVDCVIPWMDFPMTSTAQFDLYDLWDGLLNCFHCPGLQHTPRPMQAHNMILAAQKWIAETHSDIWKRRGGRDHIWLMAHDEGACYAPMAIWPGERGRMWLSKGS